jgi:hypothetical protein
MSIEQENIITSFTLYCELCNNNNNNINTDNTQNTTTGTGFFPGVRRPGRAVDHPPHPSTEVKERVELYRYSPAGSSWSVLG